MMKGNWLENAFAFVGSETCQRLTKAGVVWHEYIENIRHIQFQMLEYFSLSVFMFYMLFSEKKSHHALACCI